MGNKNQTDQLREWIDAAEHIVFFGGAGVSTESGIPDFRSEKGLYRAQQEFGRSPEEIISHSFFMAHPDTFFSYYKTNMLYADARPNAAHIGLAALEKAGKDISIVTQNIDGLHQLAGSTTVYELHGSVHRNYCLDCGATYDLDDVLDPANCKSGDAKQDTTSVPYCKICGGMVRPDVVLYEEQLDGAVIDAAVTAIGAADLLIVGGTSLVVYPAASFVNYYKGKHLILINMSATAMDSRADLVIRDPIGEVFAQLSR
jgi:NAD-dependent deacetylase